MTKREPNIEKVISILTSFIINAMEVRSLKCESLAVINERDLFFND